MPLSDWTFYASFPPSGTLDEFQYISAEEGDLIFEDAKERDSIFFRRYCRTRFTVYGADYDQFKTLLDADACDEILFHAYHSGSEQWQGKLNLKKCNWNPDTCTFDFVPDPNDEYTCVFENWEEEKNIFAQGSAVSADTFFGTLTRLTCGPVNQASPVQINGFFELNVNACLSGNDAAYTLERAYIQEITPGSSYDHYATFVTEQAVTTCSGGLPVPPPGDGWVLLVNDCAGSGTATYGRPVQVKYLGELSATTGNYWDNTYEPVGTDYASYGNAILFSDIIDGFADDCSLTVVSDFFNINPDATAPSNDAYTASSALHSLLIYQKSDIKRPDAATPATIGYMTLRDLLEYLRQMFNVYWKVDGSDLRLEHISYWSGSNGDDLTSLQPEAVDARNSFTFDEDKLRPRESFGWMDDTTDADFRGLDIVYPGPCSDLSLEKDVITPDQVFTDLGKVDAFPNAISDEGFFFMATDLISGTYYINRETGEISGEIKANAHLSWANLHENYLTWYRLQPSGTLNNVSQAFNSYRRIKRQQPIPVQYSVADYFALDLTELLKTGLGWGEIDKGTYSAAQCRYTVEILHDD